MLNWRQRKALGLGKTVRELPLWQEPTVLQNTIMVWVSIVFTVEPTLDIFYNFDTGRKAQLDI